MNVFLRGNCFEKSLNDIFFSSACIKNKALQLKVSGSIDEAF